MNIISVCAAGICVCIAAALLRGSGEIRLMLLLFACAAMFIKTAGSISEIITELRAIAEQSSGTAEYFGILVRSAAVCLVSQIAEDMCRDSGEQALASQIDLAARAALILNALPLFSEVIGMINELLT